MTVYYLVHNNKTNRTLKIGYKNGKFFKIEHKSGKMISPCQVESIGVIIPPTEKDIDSFRVKYSQLEYSKIEKNKDFHQRYIDSWFNFYNKFTGVEPKFTASDAKSIKQIKEYLTSACADNEEEGLLVFNSILENWDKLDDFHKKNTDLKYLNGRLNIIIHAIRKTNDPSVSGIDNSVSI